MKRIPFTLSAFGFSLVILGMAVTRTLSAPRLDDSGSLASGTVFHDANRNGRRDADEQGLPDVRVSNGREIVKTDAGGGYRLPVTNDTIIFVIKPGGWMTPLSTDNRPRFYYIHKPKGSPQQKFAGVTATGPLPDAIDFPLHRHEEPSKFTAIFLGDPQAGSQQQVDYLAHDIVEELIGTDAVFGITLGDITDNNPALFDSIAQTLGLVGIPWYSVLGNHDMNYDSPDDTYSTESFQRAYGPPYYAFDFGLVHFVVLDDVVWLRPTKDDDGHYVAGLGEKQLDFVRNDLALLPKDQLVVLTMHIPLMELAEKQELFHLLEKHPHTFSVSAHYHFNQHRFFTAEDDWHGDKPHHHLINVTGCGSWWRGALDEMRIPHATMSDGAPNGYSRITFEGNTYSVEYKAARRPASHQMTIYAPEEVEQAKATEISVLANTFGGSQRSKVEMKLGETANWIPMRLQPQPDAYLLAIKEWEKTSGAPKGIHLPNARKSPHIWAAPLPANPPTGTHLIHVRTTDMFGHTYHEYRVIRIR